MKKRRLFGKFLRGVLTCALLATLSFALAACKGCKDEKGKSPDKQVEFTGIKDVHISVSETDYDFSKGVLAVDDEGKTLEITIDDSAVKFGTPGQYTVKYDTANGSSECIVYVYGAPIIETSTLDIPYAVATEAGRAITSLITATDTFGGAVDVKLNSEVALNANGSVKTGEQQLSVTATDGYGNTAQKTITVNVQPSTKTYNIPDQTVDFSRAYTTVEITGSTLLSVYVGEVACVTGEYATDNGCFMLLPKLIASLGVGEYGLTLNFNDGSTDIALEITDSAEPAFIAEFDLTGEIFVETETVTLPSLGKAEYSIQEFEVKTYIQTPTSAVKQEITEKSYTLTTAGQYAYIAECIKNGNVAKTITQTFSAVSLKEYYGQNFVQEKHLSAVQEHGCTSKTYEADAAVGNTTANAFKLVLPATANSNNGLVGFSIAEQHVEKAKLAGYTALEMTIYSRSGFAVYDGDMGGTLRAYSDKTTEPREVTLRIELEKITRGTAHVYMWHNAGLPVDVYMTKLQFVGLVEVDGSLVNANTVSLISPTNCTVAYEAGKLHIHSDNTASGSSGAPTFTISEALFKKAAEKGYTHLRITIETKCGGQGRVGWSGGANVLYMDAHATESREVSTEIDLTKLGESPLWIAFYHNDTYGEGIASDLYITELEFINK
ncbi:MAG: hypothetical protein IJZ32_02450 [Clostridia bacterium]|nr:hypothetical protein [Clostridia bacterium]